MNNTNQILIYDKLIKKLKFKDITVGVIGLGYVGLPRALAFSEKKIPVIGFDIEEEIITTLIKGKTHIKHINEKRISDCIESGLFSVTNDFSKIVNVDVIIICVPTPLKDENQPDISCITSTLASLKSFLKKGQTLILESTTYPGTTEEVLKPFLIESGFNIGNDFYLLYSPEREDPANKEYKYYEIPKLIGGITNKCTNIGKILYELIDYEVIILSTTKAAEMTKLLENIYRAINIGLVNEMKALADCFNLDLYEIIKAASTKPFGFKPFYPGPGVGGHCIPIDPYYLTWKAKEFGMEMKLINSAAEINSSMPSFVTKKIINSLEVNNKKINQSIILILGMSYKKNIDDYRESPSFIIIDLLIKRKSKVYFNDPLIGDKQRKFISEKMSIEFIQITPENLRKFDCVVLLTDHDDYDYELIKTNSNIIIDTRGKFKNANNVMRA